jgi:hypothetical protein
LISTTFQPNLYPVTVLPAVLLFHLVTDDSTPYRTCHRRDTIAGAAPYLTPENATHNTADNGTRADFVVVAAYSFDVINYAVSRSDRSVIRRRGPGICIRTTADQGGGGEKECANDLSVFHKSSRLTGRWIFNLGYRIGAVDQSLADDPE